ncbi:MAG TPA: formate dehydrogenase [Phycisphaerae bacterium]|nr:formate dehydrogenase [Phycisphaerae bacterium]HNU45891.1 formate dehydrogenase [Phycisphaerae bacterium]
MARNGKAIVFDSTKCFACRSCQVACKQWNENPAEAVVPTNRGTYENPPDLSYSNWLLVHFKESLREDGSLAWNFVRQSCRHCLDAPCKQAAADPTAIVIDAQTGAVLFTEKTANEDFARIRAACPFNVPRQGPDGRLYKCVMCYDRVQNGELPACVKACPSDAIEFGDFDDMLALAEARVQAVRAQFPHATILDRRDVRLLIILGDKESLYTLQSAVATP